MTSNAVAEVVVTMYGQALESFRKGRTAEARELLERLIASDGANPETLTLLASCCFRMGDYRRTESLLRQAIEADPYSARSHYNLALAFERQGKLEDAIKACGNALHLQPDFPEAREKLAALEDQASRAPRHGVQGGPDVDSPTPSSRSSPSISVGGAAGSGISSLVGWVLKVLVILAVLAFVFFVVVPLILQFFDLDGIDLPEWLPRPSASASYLARSIFG